MNINTRSFEMNIVKNIILIPVFAFGFALAAITEAIKEGWKFFEDTK
jgi:hypothetical protein